MKSLFAGRQAKTCLWITILAELGRDLPADFKCNTCSGCVPSNPSDGADVAGHIFKVAYKAMLDQETPVYAMAKHSDRYDTSHVAPLLQHEIEELVLGTFLLIFI